MPRVQLATLRGQIPYVVEQAIHALDAGLGALDAQLATLSTTRTPPLTLDEIRRALGATGQAPLNVFQLLGGTAPGAVQFGSHATRMGLPPGTAGAGALFYETDRTALYAVQVTGPAIVWLFIGQSTPFPGTLSPDLKPTDLTSNDAGFRFASTDFNRVYVWTGVTWVDAPGEDRRGYIQFFDVTLHADFAPGAGWALCDGTAGVTRSTPAGGTTTVTVPDLTTANRFLRSVAGATGGTGGAATATTGDNSDSTEVQAGTGETVAADPHDHDVATEPPYFDAQPYFRL